MEHEIAEMERRRHEAMSRACEIPRFMRIQVVDSLGGYGSRMNGGVWRLFKMSPSELGSPPIGKQGNAPSCHASWCLRQKASP
jgi:hypothetical protein